MKIMLSGAQGVGKTTLLNELKKLHPEWGFVDEVVRSLVKEKNIKISELGDDKTQSLIMDAHLENLKKYNEKITIYDRGVLDCFVHSVWMYGRNKISQDTFLESRMKFLTHIEEYDKIFFIRPEFKIEDDGTRSNSEKFQNEITEIFEDILDEYNHVVLTGSVKFRLIQFHNAIED